MLTFFRRIRKGSLGSGQARKPASPAGRYLFYAVGEVLLVMIGILLALQVNNWNEEKKERNLGKLYTIQMYQDLNNDLYSLKLIVDTLKGQYDAAMFVMNILETGDLYQSDSIKFWRSVGGCASAIIPQRFPNTWDELKSTGKHAIIHNDSLINLVQSFYIFYDSKISNFNSIQVPLRENWRIFQSSSHTIGDFRKSVSNNYQIIDQSLVIMGNSSTFDRIITESNSPQLLSSIATGTIVNIQFFENLIQQSQSIISYMEETYPDLLGLE